MSDERTKELLDEWWEEQHLKKSISKASGLLGKDRLTIKQSHEKLAQFIRDETKKDCALMSFKDCSKRLKQASTQTAKEIFEDLDRATQEHDSNGILIHTSNSTWNRWKKKYRVK